MRQTDGGLIGLGLMGEVLAGRLMAAGFGVLGTDIDPAKNARLAARGGQGGGIAGGGRARAASIVLAVFNTDQVEEVVQRRCCRMRTPGTIVLCTTHLRSGPDRGAGQAACRARNLRFLETPVSGTSEQVRHGRRRRPDRRRSGDGRGRPSPCSMRCFPRRFHIGKVGDGGRAKLAVNLILGLNRMALAEGLTFAERMGLDPKAFLAVAKGSASYSQVMDTKGGRW